MASPADSLGGRFERELAVRQACEKCAAFHLADGPIIPEKVSAVYRCLFGKDIPEAG